jgi:hypothetical protein
MNKSEKKKILPFPPPPPAANTITCQIGKERFAIHYEIEDLPPVAPLLVLKTPAKKTKKPKCIQ